MALDPEELKRRREERAKQRAKRQAQKRKLILYLTAAAVVLLLCGLLIVKVTQGNQSAADNAATTLPPETSQAAAATQETTAAAPTTVIHLAAAGDLNVTDKVVAAGGTAYDYTSAFLDVAHILAEADLTVLNFEGNLCGAPYGSGSASAPQELADALRSAGVDMVQLANSYAINKGLSGLTDTINAIRAAGMEPLGVYADQAAYKAGKGYTIRTVNGVKIAFVAFTKGMDGTALPAGSENCVNVLYSDYESTYQTVDREKITKILDAAAEEKPDLVVAMLHWGSEYNDTFSTSQKDIVKLLQENGVDAIIGTHPHYVQAMDYDPETGMFVAYSLGDFFGDGKKAGTEYSVILDLEITKDNETGETKITGYSYTPIFTVSDDGNLRVMRLRESIAAYEDGYLGKVTAATYDAMQYALTRIEDRVTSIVADTEDE